MVDYTKRFMDLNTRMENLKCFYPFFHIYISPLRDRNLDYDVPYLALDVLVLLVEEGKLKNRSVPLIDITEHMKSMLEVMYPDRHFSNVEIKDATWTVLKFLETANAKGESYYFEYWDYTAGKNVKSPPLQLAEYDLKNDAYRITDIGLDFMINTKELLEEAKIKVSLILFQQQIKKGYYDIALQTIHNLKLEVYRKMDYKQRLLELMMYGGPEIVGEYSKFKKSIRLQFDEEKQSFMEVRGDIRKKITEIRESREEIKNLNNKIDEKNFLILKDISDEFERSFALHTRLFEQYMGLFNEYLRISKTRRKAIGTKKFLFEKTIKEHILANFPNEIHVIKIHPLLLPNPQKSFSLLKIFESQAIMRKKNDSLNMDVREDWTDKLFIDDVLREQQLNDFIDYAELLLTTLQINEQINLKTFLNTISEKMGIAALKNPNLLQFLIELSLDADDSSLDGTDDVTNDYSILKPYESDFDFHKLGSLHNSNLRLIENSIMDARDRLDISCKNLKVIFMPPSKIIIETEDNSENTDMKFIMG